MKRHLITLLLSGAALYAQGPAQSPSQSQNPPPAPPEIKPRAFVRRISAGATLTVLGLRTVRKGTSNPIITSPPLDTLYMTTDSSHRIGYGGMVQVTVTEHFAVNASVFLRRAGYMRNTDILQGTDDPSTTVDDRTHIVHNEETRVRFVDFPVTVRYYRKGHHKPGPRWFVEGGGVLRHVSHVGSSTDTSITKPATTSTTSTTYTCCDITSAVPSRRSLTGYVVGAGLQFIDDFGIRVVPEVRYTRWTGVIFNSPATTTQRNQVEGMISLTF